MTSNGITIFVSAIVSLAVTSLSGKFVIPYLRRLKFGQTIKDIGPVWHQKKQGTPTMGGIMIAMGVILAIVLALIVQLLSDKDTVVYGDMIRLVNCVFLALAFGFVGFIDDYIKVVKKQNLGLRARQKIIMQVLITLAYLATLYLSGTATTVVAIPFLGQIDLSFLYYPIMGFMIIGVVNAVNLTDGVDGLATSVTFVYAITFMIVSVILGNMGMEIFSAALAASCVGFLVWNIFPAKVFMGDTGSMFLGGAVVGIAFGVNQPILLLLVGIIYIIEAFSVILQVISFKTTGKRIFRMSPIHHHFEMVGWSENKIVSIFCIVTAVAGIIAVVSVYNLVGS